MNFIANNPDVMLRAQLRHGGQFVAAPDFARRVMRAAKQQNAVVGTGERDFQFVHVAAPLTLIKLERHRGNAALVAVDSFVKRVVSRGMDHDTVARIGPLPNHFGHHIDNRRALFTGEDPQVAAAATQALIDQRIQIVLNANITHIEDTDSGVLVNGDEFDAVLLATGRRPVTAGLNLEAAGVELTERGAIAVNDLLQTSVPHIWALGDVNGGPQFTYASLDDYRIVKSQLLGDGSYTRAQRKPMAYSVFMQTPLARIGMNEAEARDTGQPVAVKELPASAVPRLHVDGNTTGLLRAIVNPDTKEILGATLLCEGAPEVINLIKTTMDAGLPYTTLRDQVFTHPSVSEALNDLFNM